MTTYFTAHTQLAALQAAIEQNQSTTLVSCFCAAWCKTCQQYEQDFKTLSQQWPEFLFIWVDIEEMPELLGDVDVEDFPTLQIQNAHGTVYYGPMLPHAQHLDRLLRNLQHSTALVDEGPGELRELIAAAAQ